MWDSSIRGWAYLVRIAFVNQIMPQFQYSCQNGQSLLLLSLALPSADDVMHTSNDDVMHTSNDDVMHTSVRK